jgi:hypothetical protein
MTPLPHRLLYAGSSQREFRAGAFGSWRGLIATEHPPFHKAERRGEGLDHASSSLAEKAVARERNR